MRYVKLFESFNDFPNTKEEIYEVCIKYGINNYTINEDMSIDVDHGVLLSNKGLYKLPLKFNKVIDYFSCSNNRLTTLEGAPKNVGGNFSCNNNQLTTLAGSPNTIGGYFRCINNKLTTLEGSPKWVGDDFYCSINKLTTIEGSPEYVGGIFNCYTNPIHSLYKLFNYDYKWLKKSIEDYSWLDGTEIIEHRLIDVFLDDDKPEPYLSNIDRIYTLR
jgi:hypothetical protein